MNKLMIKFIKFYRRRLTEFTNKCKYTPSCSAYALGCYEKFNFFKASFLTFTRLLRCTPFFKGKYDPVPLTKKERLETYERIFDI